MLALYLALCVQDVHVEIEEESEEHIHHVVRILIEVFATLHASYGSHTARRAATRRKHTASELSLPATAAAGVRQDDARPRAQPFVVCGISYDACHFCRPCWLPMQRQDVHRQDAEAIPEVF